MSQRHFTLFLLSVALVSASYVNAQPGVEPPVRQPDAGDPNFELFGGYSYVVHDLDHTNLNTVSGGISGWDASIKVPIFGAFLGVKGDVSGHYRNDAPDFNPRAYFFVFGPQVGVHVGRKSTIFLHGMVGSAHLNQKAIPSLKSDNTLAIAAGGGFDIGLTRNWAWRFSGDYYNTHFQSGDNTVSGIVNSNFRVATGPVLRF